MADADAPATPAEEADPNQLQRLNYRCPHCAATLSVVEVLAGERVDCPRCQKPLELAVPVAQVLRDDQIGGEADYQIEAGGGDTEEIVLVTHPAAFRNRPGKTLLALLAIAVGVVGLLAAAGVGLGLGVVQPLAAAVPALALVAAGAALILLGVVPLLIWFVRSRVETLTISSARTTFRWGIVTRETTEIQHEDVRNLQVEQSAFGRLLGVGDLFLSSSGQDGLEIRAHGIPNPEKAANVVRDLQ